MLEYEITVVYPHHKATGIVVRRAFFDNRNWPDELKQLLEAYRKDGTIKSFELVLLGEKVVHSPAEVIANLLREIERGKSNLDTQLR